MNKETGCVHSRFIDSRCLAFIAMGHKNHFRAIERPGLSLEVVTGMD